MIANGIGLDFNDAISFNFNKVLYNTTSFNFIGNFIESYSKFTMEI